MVFNWSLRPAPSKRGAHSGRPASTLELHRFRPPLLQTLHNYLVGAPQLPSHAQAHFTGHPYPSCKYVCIVSCNMYGPFGRHRPPHWGLNSPWSEKVANRRRSRGGLDANSIHSPPPLFFRQSWFVHFCGCPNPLWVNKPRPTHPTLMIS